MNKKRTMRIQKHSGQDARRSSFSRKLTRAIVLAGSMIATSVVAQNSIALDPTAGLANPLRTSQNDSRPNELGRARDVTSQAVVEVQPSFSSSLARTSKRITPKRVLSKSPAKRMIRVAVVDTTNVVSLGSTNSVDSNGAPTASQPGPKRLSFTGLATDSIGFFDSSATSQIDQAKTEPASTNQLRNRNAAENFRHSAQSFVELFPVNPYRVR
jgi:hypothetical protein